MKPIFTKGTFLLSLFIFLAGFVNAHTGSINGIVKNNETHKAVEGANIYIKELKLSTVSDVFGAYFLKNVADGRYTLLISHVGYTVSFETIKIEDGITTEVITNIQPSGVNLDGVTVSARKDFTHNTISGLDLKLRPVNTAQDMLRMVPGLFISQHQGGGKAEQMFLRGFDVDHGTDVNVSVDGMPVNMVSHAHGQGYADLHFVIPELVDKMNFGKGPYQIDKGNFTTAGWVDFKTKDYLDNNIVKLEGGNFGHFRSLLGINLIDKSDDKQTAYVVGEYAYNHGYFDAPQDFNRINLTGKYTTQLSDKKILSVTLSGFRSNWEASGQVPERAVKEGMISRFGEIDGETGKTSRYNMNVQYTESVGRNGVFKTNLFASHYEFELYSNFTFFLNDSVNGDQIRQKEKRNLAGYNADYTNSYTIGRFKTKTTIGGGIRYDNSNGHELSHTVNQVKTLNRLSYGDIFETNMAGYINQAIYLLPQLVLNAGTRFDYFIHTYDDKLSTEAVAKRTAYTNGFSPRAGIYYNFSNNGRIYFNYGSGFHTNHTRVVVAKNGDGVLPKANSYDLGIAVKPVSKLLLSAAAWRLDLQQEFVYVGDEAVVERSGATRRMGIDLSARYKVLKWLYVDYDFNYTHGRSIEEPRGQDFIPLAPVITSIGGVSAKFSNGLSASVRYRYMGDRPANEDNSVIAKGYTVCDAAISYSLKKYEFGLQAQNLLNTKWNEAQFDTETRLRNEVGSVSEICFTPGTPFAYKLIAMYKF